MDLRGPASKGSAGRKREGKERGRAGKKGRGVSSFSLS